MSYRDEAASERWMALIVLAFRLLADTGFGGERSRGWGRAPGAQFIGGNLPDMILGTPLENGGRGPGAGDREAGVAGAGLGEAGGSADGQSPEEQRLGPWVKGRRGNRSARGGPETGRQ